MSRKDNDRSIGERGVENELRGKADKVKGRVKDGIGGMTDDVGLQAEGKFDKMKGRARETLGDAQQEYERRTDKRDDKVRDEDL